MPQAFAPCGQLRVKSQPAALSAMSLVQTGTGVESDILFRTRNSGAVAVLRQR